MTNQQSRKPACSACSQPVTDNAYLCRRCTDDLKRLLGDPNVPLEPGEPRKGEPNRSATIPQLVGDLVVTYTRQSRSDRSGGSKSAETALNWSDKASDALDVLINALVNDVRIVQEQRYVEEIEGPDCGDCRHRTCGMVRKLRMMQTPHNDALSLSRWLLWHVGWLRHHIEAGDILAELDRCANEINHVMDLHAERWFAGQCRAEYIHVDDRDGETDACCAVELYAKPKATSIVCRNCGTKHVVEERRKWLLAKAEDQLAHMELIGRALASMGEAVTPSQIRGYAFRGRIIAKGTDRKGRELFRVGDVVQVVRDNAAEQARKAATREAKQARKSAMTRAVSA